MHLACYPDTPRAVRLFPSRSLQRLVHQHAAACAVHGLDADAIGGEDDAAVMHWLTERASLLPTALADDLERIDEMTDERGSASLIAVGARAGVDVRVLGLDPLEVAVRAFLDHREIFESAHGRRTIETLRGTTEFAGRATGVAGPVDLANIQSLEAQLGQQFEARARSPHCRISMGRDGTRTVFTIAHGGLVRAEEALDGVPMMVRDSAAPVYLTESSLRFRPHRRDIVVYDSKAGQLRIRAGDAQTLHAYRRGFGMLLHRDPEWFGNDAIVSLEPLVRLGRAVEAPTPGLSEVRVVGLIVEYTTGTRGTIAIDSDDIWPFLHDRMLSGIEEGKLLEVTFRIYVPGVARSVLVRVRVPNGVQYGKMDDTLFRPYLEARGFLATAEDRMAG